MSSRDERPPLAAALQALSARDAMWPGIITCPPTASARDIASIMSTNQVHCVIVSNPPETAERWGVVSDLDLVAAAGRDIDAVTAGEIAATEPLTVDADDTLEHACQLMSEHAVTHLLVQQQGTPIPIGVLSTRDIARKLSAAADGP